MKSNRFNRAGKTTVIPSGIVATSQTSRFHVDTLTTLSTEIDLKQVNISIGNNDLLVDVDLKLKPGFHYALIGRNGEGKSTLMRAIADKLIPGIAENLRILLVDQVEDNQAALLQGDDADVEVDLTVLQRVVKSDRLRERNLKEFSVLSSALNAGGPSEKNVTQALATIRLWRSRYELQLAHKTALKRSGARGWDARKDLLTAEAQVELDEKKLATSLESKEENPADVLEATALLAEIQAALDVMESDSTEAQARSILIGLGFRAEQLDDKFTTLSGGWRSRCALASALLQKPDLLLCDEPNNYCDLPSVIWLQNYISSLTNTTVVCISHDRDFLDAITEELIILKKKKLEYFDGNPSEFQRFKLQKRKGLVKMKEAQDRKKEAIEKTIETGLKSAKKTGDDNRLRMVKSRQKKLDERWGMEKSAKGTRFKINRDFGVYHTSMRAAIEIEEEDKPITLPFDNPEPMRFPGALISANDISFRYTTKAPVVLEHISLTIHPGSRVALLGRNGEGKSTLVKLLVGQLPSKGVERHTRLRLGYFDQHSVEELSGELVKVKTLVEYVTETMQARYGIEVDDRTTREIIGRFGLGGKATNTIQVLSGGQKVRLALSLLAYYAPDLLVLDEVSTHLDMDTVAALIGSLRTFSGAILLVSHDRYLVRCLVEGAPLVARGEEDEEDEGEDEEDEEEEAKPGAVYLVKNKKLKLLPGGSEEYVRMVERAMKKKAG